MSVEKKPKVFPEPLANKGIDDWVDTAVGVGNHLSHLPGQVQVFALLTAVLQKCAVKSREKKNQVVRGPKNKKDYHDNKNEPDGLVLFFIGASQQSFNDS